MDELLTRMKERFGEESVWTGTALRERGSTYLRASPFIARVLLRPGSTEEVSEMLRLCNEAGQPVVPQGGLTNLVDNTKTIEEDFALSLERMNLVEEIDRLGGTMTVQAGITLLHAQQAADAAGLFFPLDLPARESAVIGGAIGTNAGGLRVVRYGMMREMVLGLEVVLADGTVLNSLNKMLKKNAGYDLRQLFIGSEGTLGVVTRAVLRLWPQQPAAATAFLAVSGFAQVAELLVLAKHSLGSQLTSFEVLWNDFYRLTTTPPALSHPPLPSDAECYVLVESLGGEQVEEQKRMHDLLQKAKEMHLATEAVIAQSPSQRAALWGVREDTQQIEAQYFPTFHYDVSLPIAAMEGYLGQIRADLNKALGEVKVWVFGHLADGNLHIGVYGSSLEEADAHRVNQVVYQPLASLGGSVSAEHGIGLRKKPYLELCRTPQEIALMRRLKAALDPRGILNPGKIFDL
jgi:FAD/FMN-containing dehydrogenase